MQDGCGKGYEMFVSSVALLVGYYNKILHRVFVFCCCCSSPEFVGERIPTLYETVALCEELDLLLFIDVKDPANVKLSQLIFLAHCNDFSNVSCSKCQLTYHQLIYVNLNAGTSSFEETVCEANTSVLQSSSYQLLA